MSNTKMTDRLDQNIINIARQQYEAKQRVKIPPVLVKLPSNGLIYPESSPLRAGSVEMRHMTAYDEDILTNTTYITAGIVFDKLLESLIVTPGINVQEISPSDREGLIISARIFGYGSSYPVSVIDPKTGKTLDRTIDLSKLNFRPFNLKPDENGEFEYIVNQTSDKLKFRFITIELSKKINPDRAISQLMENTIMQVNDIRDKNQIAEYIKYEMPASAAREYRKYMIENLPGLDFNVEFEGEDRSTFMSTFQVGTELFWF